MQKKLGLNGQAENITMGGATGSNIELKSSSINIEISSIDESCKTKIEEIVQMANFKFKGN